MDTVCQLGYDLGDITLDDVDTTSNQPEQSDPCLLLQLPDPCLLAVLQYCTDEPRTLFSAARAHSRLHQAAVLALRSITTAYNERTASSVMAYLTSHGQHIEDLHMTGFGRQSTISQLPQNLHKLTSLGFTDMWLQLQPGQHHQGVLRAGGPPLKQLQLHRCKLLDGEVGLAAALSGLPTLQHLSIIAYISENHFSLSSELVQALQQLTYLKLSGTVRDPPGLQHLPGLTNLQDLRLWINNDVMASMLSGLQLTHVELYGVHISCAVEPCALSGKAQLQHLVLRHCHMPGGSAGVAQLLSELQQLQQLTYLDLRHSLDVSAPAAAYSALTASSKLQHLDIRSCQLAEGVWQHIFPAGRQLPHLRHLDIGDVLHPDSHAAAPECSSLASCCPGLQSLHMQGLLYSSELLAGLPKLSSLQHLTLWPCKRSAEGLEVVCQLTGLRQLHVTDPSTAEGLLLQLTQLRQLTRLHYRGPLSGVDWIKQYTAEGSNDEPVWRQVLRDHLGHSDREVAQQAAAALVETLSLSNNQESLSS